MSTLKTAGELRGFLAGVLEDVRSGKMDANRANAIAKVSAQINQSLQVEVSTALELKKMGHGVAGDMVIAASSPEPALLPEGAGSDEPEPSELPAATPKPSDFSPPKRDGDKVWCDQCDMRVTVGQAVGCKSPHCKAKEAA